MRCPPPPLFDVALKALAGPGFCIHWRPHVPNSGVAVGGCAGERSAVPLELEIHFEQTHRHFSLALNLFTSLRLNLFTSWPLNLFTSWPLNLFTSWPLNLFTSWPLNLFTSLTAQRPPRRRNYEHENVIKDVQARVKDIERDFFG